MEILKSSLNFGILKISLGVFTDDATTLKRFENMYINMLAIFCVVAKWPVKGSINSRITLHNSNVCRCMAKIQTLCLSFSVQTVSPLWSCCYKYS